MILATFYKSIPMPVHEKAQEFLPSEKKRTISLKGVQYYSAYYFLLNTYSFEVVMESTQNL